MAPGDRLRLPWGHVLLHIPFRRMGRWSRNEMCPEFKETTPRSLQLRFIGLLSRRLRFWRPRGPPAKAIELIAELN